MLFVTYCSSWANHTIKPSIRCVKVCFKTIQRVAVSRYVRSRDLHGCKHSSGQIQWKLALTCLLCFLSFTFVSTNIHVSMYLDNDYFIYGCMYVRITSSIATFVKVIKTIIIIYKCSWLFIQSLKYTQWCYGLFNIWFDPNHHVLSGFFSSIICG